MKFILIALVAIAIEALELKQTILKWDNNELYKLKNRDIGVYFKSAKKSYYVGEIYLYGNKIELNKGGKKREIFMIFTLNGAHTHKLNFFYLDKSKNIYLPIKNGKIYSEVSNPAIFVDFDGYNYEYGYISAWARFYKDIKNCRVLMQTWYRYSFDKNRFFIIYNAKELSRDCL